jgi:hypothetical protein
MTIKLSKLGVPAAEARTEWINFIQQYVTTFAQWKAAVCPNSETSNCRAARVYHRRQCCPVCGCTNHRPHSENKTGFSVGPPGVIIVVNVVLLVGAQTTDHIPKIREEFLSGRQGLSHGTDSVRLGRGKAHSASFGIPNFRIVLKTYLNSSKLIMPSKVMRKNHKRHLQP